MNISRVQMLNFYGAKDAAIKNMKRTSSYLNFDQFAYSVPEKAIDTAKEVKIAEKYYPFCAPVGVVKGKQSVKNAEKTAKYSYITDGMMN